MYNIKWIAFSPYIDLPDLSLQITFIVVHLGIQYLSIGWPLVGYFAV